MGQKGKPKKNASTNLGRSIIRQQFAAAGTLSAEDAQLLETERGKHKLRSVTQCDDLEELMSSAILSGTDFTSKRGEVIVLGQEVHAVLHAEGKTEAPVDIPIPRRPAWQAQQTAVELDRNEGAAFVAWRSKMAEIEEQQGSLLTPFEKNLEVWRQLWRVLERSQLVVQIVDARNPLLFRSADLERYAHELDPRKRCMLLVNKADLLTLAQRRSWAAYFKKLNVEFVFWSAFNAQVAAAVVVVVGGVVALPSRGGSSGRSSSPCPCPLPSPLPSHPRSHYISQLPLYLPLYLAARARGGGAPDSSGRQPPVRHARRRRRGQEARRQRPRQGVVVQGGGLHGGGRDGRGRGGGGGGSGGQGRGGGSGRGGGG